MKSNMFISKKNTIVIFIVMAIVLILMVVLFCYRKTEADNIVEAFSNTPEVEEEVDRSDKSNEIVCLKEENLNFTYQDFLSNKLLALDDDKTVSFQNICDEFKQLSLHYDDCYPIEIYYCQIEIQGIHYLTLHLYHPMGDAELVVLSDAGDKLSVVGKSFIDDVDFPAVCSSGKISIYHGASDYLIESYYDITKTGVNCLDYPDVIVTSNPDCFIASSETKVHVIDEADYSLEYLESLFEGGLEDWLPFHKYYMDDPYINQYQSFLSGDITATDTDGADKFISEFQYQPDEVIVPGYCFIQSLYSEHPALVIEIPGAEVRYDVIYSENGKLKVTESFGREAQSWSKLYGDTYMLYEYMYACGCTIVELRGLDENYVYSKIDTYPSETGYILPEDMNDHDENMHDEYLEKYVDLTSKYGKRYSGAEEFLFDSYYIEDRSNIIPLP